MNVLLCAIVIYILLFFPILIKNYFVFDFNIKRLFFCFTIYALNVFGGYLDFKQGKLLVCYNDKVKAISLKSNLSSGGVGIKDVVKKIYSIEGVLTAGIENSTLIGLTTCFAVFKGIGENVINKNYGYEKLHLSFGLVQGDTAVLAGRIKWFTNGVTLARLLIKKLIGKVKKK